jgi:transposase-like protein
MSILKNKHFHDEPSAIAYVEKAVWPEGKPVCPHCGEIGSGFRLAAGEAKVREDGSKTRPARQGLWKCSSCRKQFTVRMGTIFEDSKVKLHLWLQAIALIAASKKGISSNQLSRVLGVTLKSAWFMSHRIRLAMTDTDVSPMGEGGGVVEVDETYFGRVPGKRKRAGAGHKEMVFALVERGKGVRAFHIAEDKFDNIKALMAKHMAPEAVLMTDESNIYKKVGQCFAEHHTVNHSAGEYVREGKTNPITTNTVEGFFQVFKRGMKGVYQHCSSDHLHRYVSEFAFRYNNRVALGIEDGQRADQLLKGVVGKRLTYRIPH